MNEPPRCWKHRDGSNQSDQMRIGMATHRICSVEGCGNQIHCRGYCNMHYRRLLHTGNVRSDEPPRTPHETLMKWLADHADYRGDECLKWPFGGRGDGYGTCQINGSRQTASRAMCFLAYGPPPEGKNQAAHSCGKGHEGCVNPRHLRWDSHQGNQSDRVGHGTIRKGESHHAARLNEQQVREIMAMKGVAFQKDIADKFGVSEGAVSNIHQGRTWRHLAMAERRAG